jgi:putative PIN family toxin of toxin-antitoxin system
MRVVIDTNVFISSLFGGNPKKVIELWFSGRLTLCLSRLILKEYIDVLNRFELEDKNLLFRLIAAFEKRHSSLFISNPKEDNWVLEDPGDNKFIACAKALKAEYIVSGDSHLLELGQVDEIKIVSPAEMLRALHDKADIG